MKKILIVLLFAGLMATIFYACKKNAEPIQNNSNTEQQYSDNGMLVYNKLVAFKHEMQNAQKSTTQMSIDSAQWYVEAYYNVTSGYPDSAYLKFDVDFATYSLPVDENNMISVAALSVLISDLESDLNSRILQYGSEVAHMVVGDVNISLTARSSDAEVVVTTGIGFGTPNLYTQFPLDECWYFGMTAGRCDLTPPTPPYADAGDQLELRFNNPNPIYVPAPACSGSIKIIENTFVWTNGFNDDLIYSEWKAGSVDYPGYSGAYWNGFLSNGFTLFYGNEQSGGLIPDGNMYFTAVDVFTDYFALTVGGENGYMYTHNYQTFYSVYECIPDID